MLCKNTKVEKKAQTSSICEVKITNGNGSKTWETRNVKLRMGNN